MENDRDSTTTPGVLSLLLKVLNSHNTKNRRLCTVARSSPLSGLRWPDDGMRSPGLVSPVSSVPYTSVHTMVTRLPLALLASLLAPLVTSDPWVRGGWRPGGLALWVNRDTHT